MYSQKKNVTYIDDLPELSDLEDDKQDGKFKKFIRPPMKQPYSESGMRNCHNSHNSFHDHNSYDSFHNQDMIETTQLPISCIDINKHITTCPICSKFYQNDNSIYIITIIVLSVICILLLKRILDL